MADIWSGRINVIEHFYDVGDQRDAPLDLAGDSPSGLLGHSPYGVTIFTGIWGGPVEVRVALTDSEPLPEDGWEQSEVSWVIVASGWLGFDTMSGASDVEIAVPPNRYAMRVSASGRDREYDLLVDEPVENYLIELWPAPSLDWFPDGWDIPGPTRAIASS